ncbi:M18 family aminopeptidase [Tannockella kyphosi]|uniref:M18 family aminopeptidase n=1 Tax=Tannockella kyphosi TaxID=2899121 RepID=UPI002011FA60|nr:M18 family aminopeptidase [Tannockella kyphosi]
MNTKLLEFIDASPSAFQAVVNIKKELNQAGFIELNEQTEWSLQKNQKYYVSRNSSALFAFCIPETFDSIQMAASHLDSPTFKIKANGAMIDKNQIRLDVEKYGGMILHTWFDRPLSMAGRMVVKNKKMESILFDDKKPWLMIPSVAIHLNRDVNQGKAINVQKEMLPIVGQGSDFELEKYLQEKHHIEGEILAVDAFLYNPESSKVWGINDEFLSAPRIDNLECTYAILEAIKESSSKNVLNMALFFDNEEVGSGTKQGADSSFLTDVLARIKEACHLSQQQVLSMIARGFMISADNAHGYHPGYGELYSPSDQPKINEGIVVKHNANQKYTSDAISAAIFYQLCKEAGVSHQNYYNHTNAPGGSTLGNIANTHVSLNTVDIGLAQWAMHSSYETAGTKDYQDLVSVLTYFYRHKMEICNEDYMNL